MPISSQHQAHLVASEPKNAIPLSQ